MVVIDRTGHYFKDVTGPTMDLFRKAAVALRELSQREPFEARMTVPQLEALVAAERAAAVAEFCRWRNAVTEPPVNSNRSVQADIFLYSAHPRLAINEMDLGSASCRDQLWQVGYRFWRPLDPPVV